MLWSRLRLNTQLRAVFTVFTLLMLSATSSAWADRFDVTDADWIYRIGFPISAAWLFWGGVIRPRIGHTANLFIPFSIISVFRVADFAQDWYLTPTPDRIVDGRILPGEPIDLLARATTASFGWLLGVTFVVLLEIYDRLLTARFPTSVTTVTRFETFDDDPFSSGSFESSETTVDTAYDDGPHQ